MKEYFFFIYSWEKMRGITEAIKAKLDAAGFVNAATLPKHGDPLPTWLLVKEMCHLEDTELTAVYNAVKPLHLTQGCNIDPAVIQYVDDRLRKIQLQRDSYLDSETRSDIFHGNDANYANYHWFDVGQQLIDPLDTSIQTPTATDPLFTNTDVSKRSVKTDPDVIKKGTLALLWDHVQHWAPHGRTMETALHLGANKLDVALKAPDVDGDLSIMALLVIKQLPPGSNNIAQTPFNPAEVGHCLHLGTVALRQQPGRAHVYVVLSDSRRFQFFKVYPLDTDKTLRCQYSTIFIDGDGWRCLHLLVSQSTQTLGYVPCAVADWTIGDVLGVGASAVVTEATRAIPPFAAAVAKLYTGEDALECRHREAAALDALKDIPHIPRVVPGAPMATVSNRPVLLTVPRGYTTKENDVYPLIGDYVPLVEVLHAMHTEGWLHNDVAPPNIFFATQQEPSTVFLGDFDSAMQSRGGYLSSSRNSRFLYYRADDIGFLIGPAADLRALVLSIFVLTQRQAFDDTKVTTAKQLEAVASRAQPWKNALDAAQLEDYAGVATALNSTIA